MNNLEKILVLFRPNEDFDYGSVRALAAVCEVSETVISGRWRTRGKVPVKYNHRIKAHVAAADRSPVWKQAVVDCLEPDVCPTCGQDLEGRLV
jgi:hypothetical protein